MSRYSCWQERESGNLLLRFPSWSAAALDVDDVLGRCARTVEFMREALELEPDSLPRISISVVAENQAEDGPWRATQAEDGESPELSVWIIHDLEAPRPNLPNTTIVRIAHRLETIADAEIIFVLDRSRLVEQGTHAALLGAGGLYRRLFDDQTRTLGTTPSLVVQHTLDSPTAETDASPTGAETRRTSSTGSSLRS